MNTANNAEGVAIQAQNDVSNLSGTVTNIGNRVTTAEGNITNLQGRMTTAEGNIGNLQTAVSTAQATANSAQQTATTARQQSYVFRYSSTALTPSSTNSNTLLDNTDNLKVGDKVIDSSGVLFSITAIGTQNSTFTIGTALIDLAQDSDVVHKSGDETIGGIKTFSDNSIIKKIISNVAQLQINARSDADSVAVIAGANASDGGGIWIYGKNSSNKSHIALQVYDANTSSYHAARLNMDGSLTPTVSNNGLGSQSFKWVGLNGINPGALSLPDLNNGIDISGYFTLDTSSNNYTPIADGWICIKGVASGTAAGIYVESTKGFYASANSMVDINSSLRFVNLCFPVVKGEQYTIVFKLINTSFTAKFFPCQGNV